jgi:hypothetical protein
MKRNIELTTLACLLAFLSSGLLFAQEEADEEVFEPFTTQTLIDNQTTTNPYKGALHLEIQHRFGQIKQISDLLGIYGGANTRIGLSYGITDRLMLGLGTTKNDKQQELEWKYSLMTQTTNFRKPFSISYYGNVILDASPDSKFEGARYFEDPVDSVTLDYRFISRFSYMHQFIVSQKIGEKISYHVAPTFVWHNAVKEGYRNDNYSINFGARLQVLGFHSIILEYDQPLVQPKAKPYTDSEGNALLDSEGNERTTEPKTIYPNVALGVEIGTSTHSFRVFVSNYNAIVKNRSVAFNDRNPWDGDFQFGFNITIRF